MKRWILALGAGAVLLTSELRPSAAAEKSAGKGAPEAAVLRVLRSEVVGSVDRRGALEELLDVLPARWQAGFVRDGESWRSFDAPESAASSEKRAEYAARRSDAPPTAAGQLDLANWCRRQRLLDQERAHLHAVLRADPDGRHPDILKRLGYRRVFGVWLSREQLIEWRNDNRTTEASLKQWGLRLDRIGRQLTGTEREHQLGVQALQNIVDPGVIPAIEYTLCGRDERSALAAVEALSRMTSPDATTALARQGVFSQWEAVRQAAAVSLKSRRREDFVSALVSLLSTPNQ